MRVLSLGWGVQSFTLAAMSAVGEIDRLDVAIHADTGYERGQTYAFAAELSGWLAQNGIRIETVRAREIDVAQIPSYTHDGNPVTRECTKNWKVSPVRAWLRHNRKGQPVEMWLGISQDEWHRAKDSRVGYITNRFPLLELGMSRQDCITWLNQHDLPIPVKSSCTFCPYHSRKAWAELKRLAGADWQEAIKVDAEITQRFGRYVHRSALPLAEAVDIPEDHGYIQTGFDPEGKCDEGMCWI